MAVQTIAIAASADDADELHGGADTGGVTINAASITLRRHTTNPRGGGFRFLGVLADRKSAITSAILTLTPNANVGAGFEGVFYGELYRAPATFAATAGNITNRPRTAASVAWTAGAATADTAKTIDVTTIVQELVNKNDWTVGDNIALTLFGNITANTTAQTYYAYDGDPAKCASLAITYDNSAAEPVTIQTLSISPAASGDDAEQTGTTCVINGTSIAFREHTLAASRHNAGVRAVLNLAAGNTIQSAYLRLVVKTASTLTGTCPIVADDSDDAGIFTTGANDITGRTQTTATVNWVGATDVTFRVGATGCSPSFPAVVQEIIDRAGWASGNHIAILVIANSAINASYPTWCAWDNGSLIPVLEINYTEPATPAITSITVDHGMVGDTVTIAGAGFEAAQGTGSVSFTGGGAATITSWADDQIVCVVPAGSTTGNVTVTNDTGNSDTIAWTLDPRLDTLTPNSGPVGTTVVLDGASFLAAQGVGGVTVNGVAATVTAWGATQITITIPVGATTGNVIVTANNGYTSNALVFTVTAAAGGGSGPSLGYSSLSAGAVLCHPPVEA